MEIGGMCRCYNVGLVEIDIVWTCDGYGFTSIVDALYSRFGGLE